MLFFALFLSVPLLVVAHYAARPAPQPVRWGAFVGWTAVLCVGPAFIGVIPTAAVLTGGALALALAVWTRFRHRLSRFLPLSASALLAAYGVASLVSVVTMSGYAQMRERYPYESMEDRVPAPRIETARAPLSPTAEVRLAKQDEEVEAIAHQERMRVRYLEQIHEKTTYLFVNSPGFGFARLNVPFERGLEPWTRKQAEPPDQPGSRPPASTNSGPEQFSRASPGTTLTLSDLHSNGLLDFVNPAGFGFVKDRERVAGFRSHGFSILPAGPPRLEVETVDLVGLLLNPAPVVYVSEKLPAMDHLRGAPTRALDRFEATGLEALRAGEDLHAAEFEGRVRLLGSLRNGRQCIGCHGGERGDLLGAFSYSLREVHE